MDTIELHACTDMGNKHIMSLRLVNSKLNERDTASRNCPPNEGTLTDASNY